jgi:hypothetical protein
MLNINIYLTGLYGLSGIFFFTSYLFYDYIITCDILLSLGIMFSIITLYYNCKMLEAKIKEANARAEFYPLG